MSIGITKEGKVIDVIIKDGVSFVKDTMKRIADGTTVSTGGGIYKLVNGKGVKVSSHNERKDQPVNVPLKGNGVLGGRVGQQANTTAKYYKNEQLNVNEVADIVAEKLKINELLGRVLPNQTSPQKPNVNDEVLNYALFQAMGIKQDQEDLGGFFKANFKWILVGLALLLGIAIFND